MTDYRPTLSDTIIGLLKDNLPAGYFKAFFYGDPLEIATSYLPCVMVSKENGDASQEYTGQDTLISAVKIQLAYNKKDEFGKPELEVMGVRQLEQYAEGRDPTTGEYHENSVMGILRKNFSMGQTVVNQTVHIEYGVVPRPEQVLTFECSLVFTFTEILPVNNRV